MAKPKSLKKQCEDAEARMFKDECESATLKAFPHLADPIYIKRS